MLVAAAALGACSQSDAFIGAQLDYQLRQGATPVVDLAQVGPATWSRACVLGPYSTAARARELLGVEWPVERFSSVATRDDRFVLVFTDGAKVLGFVERERAAGDFTTLQPPCVAREAARLATRREADGRLVVAQAAPAL